MSRRRRHDASTTPPLTLRPESRVARDVNRQRERGPSGKHVPKIARNRAREKGCGRRHRTVACRSILPPNWHGGASNQAAQRTIACAGWGRAPTRGSILSCDAWAATRSPIQGGRRRLLLPADHCSESPYLRCMMQRALHCISFI